MKIMINFCFKIYADTAEAGRAADILVRELNDRAAAVRRRPARAPISPC